MNWYMNTASTGAVAVTALTSIGGVFDITAYGLDLAMNGTGNYAHVQVDSTSGSTVFPMNWATCGIIGLQAYIWANPATGSFTAKPYVVTSAANYGGTYNGWNQQCGSPGPGCSYSISAGSWGTISLTLNPAGTGNWAADETSVTGVGIDFNQGSAQATDYVIDQVILY
jgi:hypothetical protein